MSVINYLKKVQLPNNTEYTVKDPTFFTGTTAEWNLLSTEEKKTYQIVNLTDDEEEGDISEKADKVTGATAGNFAGLDGNGNLTDSGHKHSDYLTQHQDISGKADKVSSATNGNLAGLNGSGNLTDSGWNGAKDTTSISGNPISISGLKSNQLAKNPIITFEPIQAGSGTPSPSNIRAISGYDKIEVLSCGKNIFNGEVIQGRWSHTDGTWVEQATFWATKNPIPVIGGQSNYISNVVYRAYYDKNMTFISGDGTGNAVATTPANAVWMHITQAKADWSSPSTTMVAISNTAIDYVPYVKATSISESLGQTVYGGMLDLRSGKLTVTYGIIDLGDYDYDRINAGSYYYFRTQFNASIYFYTPQDFGMCSCYNYREYVGGELVNNGEITITSIYYSSSQFMLIRDDNYTDATAFKTAVTGQKLVYLITPIEIQLTPHEISLLTNYAYVSTNGTSIALDYHNGELASLADVAQVGETVNALPNFFLPDYANALSVHSGALEINSSYSEYIAPQNGYIIIAEMYGAVDTSSTPFSPPYFDCRIDQKRIFSTQAFLATNERASGTIIPIAKGSLFQYRVTNKKLNELIIWFAPIKYV